MPILKQTNLESARLDIHNIDSDLMHCLQTLKAEASPENWKLLEKYNVLLTASTMSKAARRSNLRLLLSLNRLNENKPWDAITRDDVDFLSAHIMQNYSPDGQETWYTRNHKSVLAAFVRWIKLGSRDKQEVGDPIELKGLKIRQPRERLTRDALLDTKDLANLIAATPHLQIKALVDSSDEAATRIGEMLTLKIKNLQFDEYGAVISVDGKTGPRPIRLVRSSKILLQWYNAHPMRDDPNASLFIGCSKNTNRTRLKYGTARYHIVQAATKGHIHKRIYFHLLRHSGATNAANYLTEAQMRQRHGWSKGSPTPARYVHLVNADVESAVLKHHGLAKQEEPDVMKKCPTCKWLNAHDAELCEQCEKPLDVKTAIKLDEKRRSEIRKAIEEEVLEKLNAEMDLRIQKITNERLEQKLKELLNSKTHDDK